LTTSDTVRGTLRPSPQPHDPVRALLRAGNNDAAIVQLCSVVLTHPDDLAAKELLFDAFFQKREWAPALVLAEELVRRQPDIARLHKGLIATLSNMKRYDDVIPMAAQYVARNGEDLTILDTLKVANFYTGKTEEAIRHGQRALDLRDAEARRNPLQFTFAPADAVDQHVAGIGHHQRTGRTKAHTHCGSNFRSDGNWMHGVALPPRH
jgi:tetratricopeptide (TPR) repeat protein